MDGDRGFILILNEEKFKWEIWHNLGDRGEWLRATIHGSKALAERIRIIIEEDYYKEIADAYKELEDASRTRDTTTKG